jgi:7,8-dihydropterin-6-yl-methyl-4-(beta-D-ribofuranosyl)aminobenzene 5'-phosphate synthase
MEPTARPPALDELVLTVLVDNETDSLSSIDEGIPQLPEIATHLARVAPTTLSGGHQCHQVFDRMCVACHGFSVLATARRGDETHRLLFDVGPYGDVWLDNAERLGVDLASIGQVFLSHWHWDHSGGLPAAVEAIAAARSAAGLAPLVVDLHPDRPDQRGAEAAPGVLVTLPPEPTFAALDPPGAEIVLHADAHLVAGGLLLGSGEIPRVTDYEIGLAGHHSIRDGRAEADPLILDERFVAAEVAGRGVTVLSACSHAGIVNACLGARAAFPGVPLDVVLGGYHLVGRGMEERIEPTVRDLGGLEPRVVAPGHCTGWRAKAALVGAFPGRYGPSVVGTTYVLSAS